MMPSRIRGLSAMVLAAVSVAACGRATRHAEETSPRPAPASQSQLAAIADARADSIRHPYTEADIHFMTGMIAHHAQALVMAGWAPSHGANASVRTLCARIINGQRDEIVTMQRWLRDRRQPVPEPSPDGMMTMHGTAHEMLMPGMLTAAQMKELDQARGAEFDRLFLTFMIQHHRGALSMVKELFGSYGAAQDELVFKLASGINVDQMTEIARMQRMLVVLALGGAPSNPSAVHQQ